MEFPDILGMSSSQLNFHSIIFQRGRAQPPTSTVLYLGDTSLPRFDAPVSMPRFTGRAPCPTKLGTFATTHSITMFIHVQWEHDENMRVYPIFGIFKEILLSVIFHPWILGLPFCQDFSGTAIGKFLPLRMWMNFDRRSWMRQRVTHWNSEISHHCGFYQRDQRGDSLDGLGWVSWLLFVLESDTQWYTAHIYIIIYNHIYNIIIMRIIIIIVEIVMIMIKNNNNNNNNNNNIYIYMCDMEFGVIQQKKTCRVILQHWQWGSISFMKWWAKHA